MLARSDAPPPSLRGRVIDSETQSGVQYVLERRVGEGGMGTAYLARRESPEGSAPVVVKVMRPTTPGAGAVAAETVAAKEAVALGRLNEHVPPTPFVVRFVDAGSARLFGTAFTPWTAIEYVHGGVEGTTLEDRVTYSLHKTGYAFDASRAAHAIRCLASGLSAIHAVGVIHRDLSPGNVLCCGFGGAEIFKISDFGVARAAGLDRTFAGLGVGTLGYSAPEAGETEAGPHSDVFSLSAIVYYLLTGQHYFEVDTPTDAILAVAAAHRPSITDHPTLSPDLLERPDVCRSIDAILARSTGRAVETRPQMAEQLAAWLLQALGDSHAGPQSSLRLLSAVRSSQPAPGGRHRWVIRSRPRDDLVIRSAAWDTDGHAFALTSSGAGFWNGTSWLDASSVLAKLPTGMTFTERYEAGGWLVGGESPVLSVIDHHGVADRIEGPAGTSFSLASGRLSDLLVAVGHRPGEPPSLLALSARRWMRPIPLHGVAYVATLQRIDDARWLLGGRWADRGGFAAIYSPMQWEATPLSTPPLRAFVGGAAAADRAVATLVGSDGMVLRVDGDTVSCSQVPSSPDLAAAAADVLDDEWVASRGAVWSRNLQLSESWHASWSDPTWPTPFISLMADAGMVVAMTADGGILEGRVSESGLDAR